MLLSSVLRALYVPIVVLQAVLLYSRTALFPVHDVFGGAQTHIGAAQTHFGSRYAHFGWCPNTS
jgi:hypothetical protein